MRISQPVVDSLTTVRQSTEPHGPPLPEEAPFELIAEITTQTLQMLHKTRYITDAVFGEFFWVLRILRCYHREALVERCTISKRSSFYQTVLKPMGLPETHPFWRYFCYG